MKKYCLLIISILCLCIFFTGCSVSDEPPVDTVLQDGTNGTRIIDEVFKKTFNVENINDYVLQDVYAGSDFVIYEAYKKDAEKNPNFFVTGNLRFEKESTGEFDRFDYLLFRDNKLTSLIEELERHTFNYLEVDEMFKYYEQSNLPATTQNNKEAWVTSKIAELKKIGVISEDLTNIPLSTAAYLYNLNNWDYKWVVLYSKETSHAINDCIFIKYETEEQKENLLKSIQYRIDTYIQSSKIDEFKTKIIENQRLYLYDNTIVWICKTNYSKGVAEAIDELFADSERIR